MKRSSTIIMAEALEAKKLAELQFDKSRAAFEAAQMELVAARQMAEDCQKKKK